MGARGPKKTPVEIKRVQGTQKKSRDPDPIANNYAIPENPYDATARPDEHQAWMQLVRGMIDSGTHIVLTPADFAALEHTAVALTRARQWSDEVAGLIAENQRYVETQSNGKRPHPAFTEEPKAWAAFRAAAASLGLDPSTRANLAKPDGAFGSTPASDDPLMSKLLAIGPQPVDARKTPTKRRPATARVKPTAAKRTPPKKG